MQSLVELDSFVLTHGPFTSVDGMASQSCDGKCKLSYSYVLHCVTDVAGGAVVPGVKRKQPTGRTDSPARRPKHPAYFIPELAHAVAMCDERIPFVNLSLEVIKHIASIVEFL